MPKAGDVVLVPFLFTDLSDHKIRPAVVLAADARSGHVILCFITTRDKISVSKVSIKFSSHNGLKEDSYAIPSKIMTIEKKIILGSIGKLEKKYIEEIKEKLRSIFRI